jgi:hypothetical protein
MKADGTPFVGGGLWMRANPEQCWPTRGSPLRLDDGVRKAVATCLDNVLERATGW